MTWLSHTNTARYHLRQGVMFLVLLVNLSVCLSVCPPDENVMSGFYLNCVFRTKKQFWDFYYNFFYLAFYKYIYY